MVGRGAAVRAVFVDGTGRRRRLFTVAGSGLAAAALAALGLLAGGLSGAAPLRLPGLPPDAAQPRSHPVSHAPRSPAGPATPRTRLNPLAAAPSAGAAASTTATTTPASASPSVVVHSRRSSPNPHPGQSRRK